MTNEQRESIDYLKESVLIYKNTIPKISDAIDTVLSLIKEQDKYIKDANDITTEMSNDIKKLTSEIKKKDKQIELMAELVYKRFKAELLLEYGFENEEQLKQYFGELAEEE